MSLESCFGWPKEWIDEWGLAKVNELFVKQYVNRYFALPEDWDDDDVPLLMIWVRCITCGSVKEYFMRETEEEWEQLIYNWDNTHTSFAGLECDACKSPYADYSVLEALREERSKVVEEIYQDLEEENIVDRYIYDKIKGKLILLSSVFESPLEESFWKTWMTKFPNIPLIPQYQIGNYRVDFVYLPSKTAIEIDGKLFHTTPDQVEHDRIRQSRLEQQGWRFIRFQGKEVHYHVDRCVLQTLLFLSKAPIGYISLNEALYNWGTPVNEVLRRLQERYQLAH